MRYFRNLINRIAKRFLSLYSSSKFLLILCFMCLIFICISVFVPALTTDGNIVIIRSSFSAIIGYLLESASKKLVCGDKQLAIRNFTIGIIAIIITIVIMMASLAAINIYDPSLVLLKNTLSSCIGFLISSSKSCGEA